MRKIIYTMVINDYASEIVEITRPALEHWAKKIDAEIKVISKRKFLDKPVTYEKFQLYEMAKKDPADWHIFVDADAYIKNDFLDITELVPKTNVIVAKGGSGNPRFRTDNYMRRYGHHIDVGSWFFALSDWTLDAFKPPHLQSGEPSVEELIDNIFPQTHELNGPVPVIPSHLIDDYVLCRNIAKYGIKVTYISEAFPNAMNGLAHTCFDTTEAKTAFLTLVRDRDEKSSWSLLTSHEWANDIKFLMQENTKKKHIIAEEEKIRQRIIAEQQSEKIISSKSKKRKISVS
jgi:hypothetical protein